MKISKKIIALFIALAAVSASGCADKENSGDPSSQIGIDSFDINEWDYSPESITESQGEIVYTDDDVNSDAVPDWTKLPDPDPDKTLIVYFTCPQGDDTDANTSASRNLESGGLMGNVEYVASLIQEKTGGDLARIETVDGYPITYNDTVTQAESEQNESARPNIVDNFGDITDYGTVYLGFPNWLDDMPMAVYSFLDRYELGKKTVKVFICHESSGAAAIIADIQRLEPGANVSGNSLVISGSEIHNASEMVDAWLG